MKIFNTIESEYSGEILDILVNDGEPVEFGQELFLIKEIDV
jgi:biotin carboxyl carrier protein